jgi:MFS family permease
MAQSDLEPDLKSRVTPQMDRLNGRIIIVSQIFTYLAAPVIYVGVVQAAICDKLGAGAFVSNLPGAAYLLGAFTPFVLAWLLPHRADRAVLAWSYHATAASMTLVCVTFFLPFPDGVRIAAVIIQGLIQGVTGGVAGVYFFQCVGRGTTEKGRARAFKIAFGMGPIAAVIGSLASQFVLNNGLPGFPYPYDFGLLYLAALPCMIIVAVLFSRLQLVAVPEEEHPPFFAYLRQSILSFAKERELVLTWLAFLLWYFTLNSMPNFSLYTREAVGRDPKELSGLIMAVRFGCKALAGFGLGMLAARAGSRAPLTATVLLVGGGALWAWIVPGYSYLFAFGLMGAGELGGAYFPYYLVAISSPAEATRNLALQMLVSPLSSVSPAIHGALTDWIGFRASFAFAVATAALALALLGARRRQRSSPDRG